MESKSEDKLFVEYFVPITQSAHLDGDFIIEGVAINETTTSNGHKFLGDELRSSAPSLVGVPLLKDHNNSVDSIVGRVRQAHFNETTRNIPFSAVVKDDKMKQMIRDNLIDSVSVGAHVDPKNIEETEDGDIIPHGIIFKELSLVAVPADSGATFDVALNNAYQAYSTKTKVDDLSSTERGKNTMTEEEEKTSEEEQPEEPKEVEEPVEEPKEESEDKPSEEAEVEEKIRKAKLELKKLELKTLEKQLKSADADEEEESEEEEESNSEEVEEGDYNLKQGYGSFTMERKSYVYN